MKNNETEVRSIAKFLRWRKWLWRTKLICSHKVFWYLLTLSVVVGVFLCFKSSMENPISNPGSILRDSIHVSPILAAEHNSALVSILSQRESAFHNQDLAEESWVWQARMFYSAIVAAVLASTLFARNRDKRTTKCIRLVLIAFISFMYLVEVHLEDLRLRDESPMKPTIEAIDDSLLNRSRDDSTWFKLDYSKIDTLLQRAGDDSTHSFISNSLCRKLRDARHPDLVQIGFYVIPFYTLCFLVFTGSWRKKQDAEE